MSTSLSTTSNNTTSSTDQRSSIDSSSHPSSNHVQSESSVSEPVQPANRRQQPARQQNQQRQGRNGKGGRGGQARAVRKNSHNGNTDNNNNNNANRNGSNGHRNGTNNGSNNGTNGHANSTQRNRGRGGGGSGGGRKRGAGSNGNHNGRPNHPQQQHHHHHHQPQRVVHNVKRGMDLTHLVNYTSYSSEQRENGTSVMRGRGSRRSNPSRRSNYTTPYRKETFIHANYRLFVSGGEDDYMKSLVDPDHGVNWDKVEMVVRPTDTPGNCPICLDPPVAAKITRCGHVFCGPCIYHYLDEGEKNWKRCPLCFESIYRRCLRSFRFSVHKTLREGEEVELVLVKRRKASTVPTPVLWDNGVRFSPAPPPPPPHSNGNRRGNKGDATEKKQPEIVTDVQGMLTGVDTRRFARLTIVNNISSILNHERKELYRALHDLPTTGIDLSRKYIELALSLTDERAEEWVKNQAKLKAEQQEAAANDSNASTAVPTAKDVFGKPFELLTLNESRSVFSDSESEEDLDAEAVWGKPKKADRGKSSKKKEENSGSTANSATTDYPPLSSSPSSSSQSLSSTNPAAVEKKKKKGIVTLAPTTSSSGGPAPSTPPTSTKAEPPSLPKLSASATAFIPTSQAPVSVAATDADEDVYYFYQSLDGQQIYLHSLNVRCLTAEFGSIEMCPRVIRARIIEKEDFTQDPETRRRNRFLSHLPLTSQFSFAYVDLSHCLSASTMKKFGGEISKRRRARERKSKDLAKMDRLMKEREKKMMEDTRRRMASEVREAPIQPYRSVDPHQQSHFPTLSPDFNPLGFYSPALGTDGDRLPVQDPNMRRAHTDPHGNGNGNGGGGGGGGPPGSNWNNIVRSGFAHTDDWAPLPGDLVQSGASPSLQGQWSPDSNNAVVAPPSSSISPNDTFSLGGAPPMWAARQASTDSAEEEAIASAMQLLSTSSGGTSNKKSKSKKVKGKKLNLLSSGSRRSYQ